MILLVEKINEFYHNPTKLIHSTTRRWDNGSFKKVFILHCRDFTNISYLFHNPSKGEPGENRTKKGAEVRLEKDGSVIFSLDSPMKVKKLITKGKWVKVQITGWVMRSKIVELSSKKEM